jgi:hypothetical protein
MKYEEKEWTVFDTKSRFESHELQLLALACFCFWAQVL